VWKVKHMKIAQLLVLGIAVAAGGGAFWLAGRSDAPPPAQLPVAAIDTVDVLVTTKDINSGQVISAEDMDWRAWPTASKNSQDVRKTDQAGAKEQLMGRMTRAPIPSGWPVRTSNLIDANGSGYMAAMLPVGKRAVSTEIALETGVGGFILPHDHVDVILTRRDRESEKRTGVELITSETLLSNIPVRAIDQAIEEKNGVRTVVGKTATLEVTPLQVEALARARQAGTVSLSLRSLVDSSGSNPDAPPILQVAPVVPPSLPVVQVCRPLQCEGVIVNCWPRCEQPTPLAQDASLQRATH
jgi:pilus assembly protein CpaB